MSNVIKNARMINGATRQAVHFAQKNKGIMLCPTEKRALTIARVFSVSILESLMNLKVLIE